jgi:carbon-monoxide dehydrogenase medium subunit
MKTLDNFKYVKPGSLKHACELLADNDQAKALAGGTALIYQLKRRLVSPSHLVNLKLLPGLDCIEYDPRKGLRIGALTRLTDLGKVDIVKTKYPCLPDCVKGMGSIQMRNLATVGGNLCHGEPAADLPPLLIALGAKVVLAGADGERNVRLDNFYRDFYETALRKGEILEEVQIPRPRKRTGSAFIKYNPRSVMDMGVISVAATVTLEPDDDICRQVRIALGGAAPTVIRVREAEDLLKGKKLTGRLIGQAAESAAACTDPISDFRASAEYRMEMAAVYTEEAVVNALDRAQSS